MEIAILSITILFLIFILGKEFIYKYFGIRICAICCAVCLTWISLLALKFTGVYEISDLTLGILMGGSVVGIMYKLEDKFKENKWQGIWFYRPIILTSGFLLVYYLLNENWTNLISVMVIVIFISFIGYIYVDTNKEKKNKDKNQLLNKLQNCCD